MRRVLIGGGWTPSAAAACYGPFLSAATTRSTPEPVVGCLVVDEGDGAQYAARFASVLGIVAPCRPTPVLVPLGADVDPVILESLDAPLVCGGLTPAYATALRPVYATVREWVANGHPYAGFSAGSALAATTAIVGGYRYRGRAVCPPDAGEDLDEVSLTEGLGLVPFAVDVHAGHWGSLGRVCALVADGQIPVGIALDEDTALVINDDAMTVVGNGAAHVVTDLPSMPPPSDRCSRGTRSPSALGSHSARPNHQALRLRGSVQSQARTAACGQISTSG